MREETVVFYQESKLIVAKVLSVRLIYTEFLILILKLTTRVVELRFFSHIEPRFFEDARGFHSYPCNFSIGNYQASIFIL